MAIRVLLVDDSRAMREYVSSILESDGRFEVDEVDNGFDALRALPRGDYELIITDVNMPDVSGVELSRFIRQTKRHANTPLVVISTDASDVDLDRIRKAGATEFIAKPFTSESLLEVVGRLTTEVETGS